MHLGFLGSHTLPSAHTNPYLSIPYHTIHFHRHTLSLPTIHLLSMPYFPYHTLAYHTPTYHTSHALDPTSITLVWAAALVNIKSGAVTRSLTLNLLILLLDHQKQFPQVFLNSQNESDRPASGGCVASICERPLENFSNPYFHILLFNSAVLLCLHCNWRRCPITFNLLI